MFGSRRVLSAVAVATALSLGVLVAWYVVMILPMQYLATRGARSRVYEQMTILQDGTPLIATTTLPGLAAEYRDLAGEVVARGPSPQTATGLGETKPTVPNLPASFASPISLPAKDVRQGRSWSHRILGLSDGVAVPGERETLWYFIRGPRNKGGAYFSGFDERSGELVGHLGAYGYQTTRPTREERFKIGENFGMHQLATAQYAYFGQVAHGYLTSYGVNIGAPEIVYFALPDSLMKIDLKRRTVRALAQIAGIMAVVINPNATTDGDERLYVRTPEMLLLMDQDGNVSMRFPIPQDIQDDDLQVYRVPNGGIVIDALRDYHVDHHLFWVDAMGSVSRREEIRLATRTFDPIRESPMLTALLVPAPLAIAVAISVEVARSQSFERLPFSESAGEAVTRLAASALFHVILAVGLAWFVYRRERFDGKQGIGWGLFVFLIGLPGLVGYLFHGPKPVRIACKQCQKPVLCNRLDCSSCGAPVAARDRRSTEIFG